MIKIRLSSMSAYDAMWLNVRYDIHGLHEHTQYCTVSQVRFFNRGQLKIVIYYMLKTNHESGLLSDYISRV